MAATNQPKAEEWIFEVVMPPFLIVDGIYVYQFESQYYLPLIELAAGLEFFVEPDLERGRVSGWVVDEGNSFVIDTQRNILIIRGQQQTLPPEAVLAMPGVATDDFYVQLEVLNEIWPVLMQVDLAHLSISLETQQELAFESRLKRKDRRDKILARNGNGSPRKKDLIFVENPHQWFGKPILDIQSVMSYEESRKMFTASNTIAGTQQIAKMMADFSGTFSYDNEKELRRPSNVRLRFQRDFYEEDSPGFGLKNIQAGDVNLRQRNLIDNSISGRGVLVTSFAGDRREEFDNITIEGTGPPGWEIELYQNNELIRFGEIEADGEYRFEDVLLRFGNNRIRTVFYGPQGQIREEVENYNFGSNMLPPGKFKYSAGVVDSDREFLFVDNDTLTEPKGLAANAFLSYGLNRHITLFGSASEIPSIENDKKFITAGAAFSAIGGVGSVEAYEEIDGGHALDTRFITDIQGIKLNIRNSFFNHFESSDAGFNGSAKKFEGEYQANTSFTLPVGVLGLNLNALHRENENGDVSTDFDTQQSISRGGVRLSHDTNTQFQNRSHQRSNGRVNTTLRMNKWQVRGGINYDFHPEVDLTSAQTEIRYRAESSPLQAALDLRHNFEQSTSLAGVQLGYDFGKVLGSFDTDYETDQGWDFTLRLSTSIHPYNTGGGYGFDSRNQRNMAPVRGHVFLDKNSNGEFDPEQDEPLEYVRLRTNNGRSKTETDENGHLTHKLNGQVGYVEVTLDEGSLGDPYYKPAVDGYQVRPLPGSVVELSFPVVETGAINGTAMYDNGQPVTGIRIQLVDNKDSVVQSTDSAYDGFYIFEFVEPGDYVVRADPIYGVNMVSDEITLSSDDLFINGMDLQIIDSSEEQAAL